MYGCPFILNGSGVMYSSMHACRAGMMSVATVIFFSMRLKVLPDTEPTSLASGGAFRTFSIRPVHYTSCL